MKFCRLSRSDSSFRKGTLKKNDRLDPIVTVGTTYVGSGNPNRKKILIFQVGDCAVNCKPSQICIFLDEQ
jgi:hypothetical protein